MVNADTISKILEISGKDHEIKEINGFTYHVNGKSAGLVRQPKVSTVKLFSLTQASNFIKSLVLGDSLGEVSEKSNLIVNVIDETNVEIFDGVYNDNLERNVYASLSSDDIFKEFESGQRMTQEEIIIELMTKFVQDDSTRELLELVSSVKSDNEASFKDSGFSQTVNVKAGVSLVSSKTIKNLFHLRTYRTFPEVEQPVIPYILRLHDGRDGKPMFALYSADGGQWKVEATKQIREFLSNSLKTNLADKFEQVTIL